MTRTVLLNAATAVSTGAAFPGGPASRTFQATVKGTGAVSATVVIEGTNDGENFLPIATITLTGTTLASDGFPSVAPWAMTRANLTAISGTNAAVTVVMGS